jgi:uncharacterized membrane protein YbhN (UPF0104 family)
MSSLATRIFKNAIGFFTIVWLVYFMYAHWHEFSVTQKISRTHLALIGGGVLLTWIINSIQVLVLFRAQQIRVGFIENLLVQTMTILCNHLPMRIGTILRFKYFKVVHNLEYSRFGGMMAVRGGMLLFTAIFASLAALFSGYDIDSNYRLLLVISAIILLSSLIFLCFSGINFKFKNQRIKKLSDAFFSAFQSIKNTPMSSIYIMLLMMVQFLLLAFRLSLCFKAMGMAISFSSLLVIAPTGIVLSFITISPGNLGLREWVMGVITSALGYDFGLAIFAGMIDRAVLTVLTFVFGFISYGYVWKKTNMNDIEMNPIENRPI